MSPGPSRSSPQRRVRGQTVKDDSRNCIMIRAQETIYSFRNRCLMSGDQCAKASVKSSTERFTVKHLFLINPCWVILVTTPLCERFRQEISAAKSAKNKRVQSTTSGMSPFRSGWLINCNFKVASSHLPYSVIGESIASWSVDFTPSEGRGDSAVVERDGI